MRHILPLGQMNESDRIPVHFVQAAQILGEMRKGEIREGGLLAYQGEDSAGAA